MTKRKKEAKSKTGEETSDQGDDAKTPEWVKVFFATDGDMKATAAALNQPRLPGF